MDDNLWCIDEGAVKRAIKQDTPKQGIIFEG
jgi:hypothetical protein